MKTLLANSWRGPRDFASSCGLFLPPARPFRALTVTLFSKRSSSSLGMTSSQWKLIATNEGQFDVSWRKKKKVPKFGETAAGVTAWKSSGVVESFGFFWPILRSYRANSVFLWVLEFWSNGCKNEKEKNKKKNHLVFRILWQTTLVNWLREYACDLEFGVALSIGWQIPKRPRRHEKAVKSCSPVPRLSTAVWKYKYCSGIGI